MEQKPVGHAFLKSANDIPQFKEDFIKRYSALTEYKTFEEFSLRLLRRSIRVNTLKTSVKDVVKRLEPFFTLTPVPWCKEGFYIKGERKDIGNTKEHVLGYYYVQEAASMIPPICLEVEPGMTVLDLCASPGSKTTQIAQYMDNKGLLIANDVDSTRLPALGFNLQRMGVLNAVISLNHGRHIPPMEFDRILVDAPCSGVGAIRKSYKAISMWNVHGVRKLAGVQKQLLINAFKQLKSGGILVYSTCTLEPEENEGVVDALLKTNADAYVMDIELPIIPGKAVLEFEGETYDPSIAKTLRLWPQDNDTEGFYVAKIGKR